MRPLAVILALAAAAPAGAQQTPPDSARVYELAEVEVLPRPQNVPDLIAALHQGYPPHLRAAGVGGTVHVAFVVGPQGQPADVHVLSTPDSSFNTPSVQAVSLLRFTPAQVQGRPVAVRVEQPITWRVEPEGVARAQPTEEIAEDEFELSGVEELPRPLNAREFQVALAREYPQESVPPRATVQVRFRVEPDGTVTAPHVTYSTDARFNEPTLRAVQVLRFRPARVNGRPVKAWVEQPIQWTQPPALRSSGDPLAGAGGTSPSAAGKQGCEAGCEVSEVEELPRMLNALDFHRAMRREYPRVDNHPGVQATVRVRFRVEEDGTTSGATITSSTDPRFNTPTLRAVQVLRFSPARRENEAVKVWVEQPIVWSLVRGMPGWQDTETGASHHRARRLGSPSYTTPSPP